MRKTTLLLLILILLVALFIPTSCKPCWPCFGNPAIEVIKYVSVDHGDSWSDANSSTGAPEIYKNAGVKYQFVVTNIGDVELTNVTLTDSNVDIKIWDTTLVSPLPVGGTFTCTIGFGHTSILAQLGPQINTATATGDYNGVTYADTDVAWYCGMPRS